MIASFSGDLSSLAAPPYILSTTSLVEYSSYWADRPSLFVAPVNEPDPAKRSLLVLKWFLSTLRQRTAYRDGRVGGEKKPLNPFLGELFLAKWEDAAGITQIVSEQVRYAHGFLHENKTNPEKMPAITHQSQHTAFGISSMGSE